MLHCGSTFGTRTFRDAQTDRLKSQPIDRARIENIYMWLSAGGPTSLLHFDPMDVLMVPAPPRPISPTPLHLPMPLPVPARPYPPHPAPPTPCAAQPSLSPPTTSQLIRPSQSHPTASQLIPPHPSPLRLPQVQLEGQKRITLVDPVHSPSLYLDYSNISGQAVINHMAVDLQAYPLAATVPLHTTTLSPSAMHLV